MARLVAPLAALGCLAGCSKMRFTGPAATPTSEEDKGAVTMTNVEVEMTSGTVLMRKVAGGAATYSPAKGLVKLDKVVVEGYDASGKALQAETRADKGLMYLADAPSASRSHRDIEFMGGVRHRSPSATDPTTDTLTLTTERMLWDEKQAAFHCPGDFKAVVRPAAKGAPKPAEDNGAGVAGRASDAATSGALGVAAARPAGGGFTLAGREFYATRDLKSWTVGGGTMSTSAALSADTAGLRRSIAALSDDITSSANFFERTYPAPKPPPPIEIPAEATGH